MPKDITAQLEGATFPDFSVASGTGDRAKALGDVVERIMQAWDERRAAQETKRRVGDVVISWFTASYPFATLLITVLKEGAAVNEPETVILIYVQIPILNPYGLLCGGLLALMKVLLTCQFCLHFADCIRGNSKSKGDRRKFEISRIRQSTPRVEFRPLRRWCHGSYPECGVCSFRCFCRSHGLLGMWSATFLKTVDR